MKEGISEQRPEWSQGTGHVESRGSLRGRENSTCKGPGVRMSLQNSKKASVPAAQ